MSGRKYSRVALENQIREALECRLAAEEAALRDAAADGPRAYAPFAV